MIDGLETRALLDEKKCPKCRRPAEQIKTYHQKPVIQVDCTFCGVFDITMNDLARMKSDQSNPFREETEI